MPTIDTDKLAKILAAAQAPAFTKLLAEKEKAQEAVQKAQAHLEQVEARLVSSIPPELADLLTPSAPAAGKRGRKASSPRVDLKKPDLQELKAILSKMVNKTLSVRAEGYDTPNIKKLAEANPGLLEYKAGPWPTVTLIK